VSRKTIGHRLLRIGHVPRKVLPTLESEGIRILDEGIRVRLELRRYVAPGRRFGYRHQVLSGSIVLTQERIAAYVWWGTLFNVSLVDPRLSTLSVSTPTPDLLKLGFDVGDFQQGRSGRVECRFHTDRAEDFAAAVGGRWGARERDF